MKKGICLLFSLTILLSGPLCLPARAASWSGVDETVIEKFAEAAGRPTRAPFINTDQGDLLLFVFLIAGIVGGFIGGYSYRALFPPRRRRERKERMTLRVRRVHLDSVTPAKAGVQKFFEWIPASAGMTKKGRNFRSK
jgi:cobalt/nickel transport protein